MAVRITRAPWDGTIGTVRELPARPHKLDNGLRLPCARLELPGGRTAVVPLANLEMMGEPSGMLDTGDY
jgi:hypothetical protein